MNLVGRYTGDGGKLEIAIETITVGTRGGTGLNLWVVGTGEYETVDPNHYNGTITDDGDPGIVIIDVDGTVDGTYDGDTTTGVDTVSGIETDVGTLGGTVQATVDGRLFGRTDGGAAIYPPVTT